MDDLTGLTIDRYHILDQIGHGGMAVVYKAHDLRLEREVAFKIIWRGAIPPDEYEGLLVRFNREAKAQASFDHPNIIPVYDYGEYEGAPYLVMAYRKGGTLRDMMKKRMPYWQAAALLKPIANALAYAHSFGVLHRDVKPGNVLIADDGTPALIDFGIIKLLEKTDDQSLTGTGLGIGTLGYIAPEQWYGRALPQSDVYGLGVIFYELVTGVKPYVIDPESDVVMMPVTGPLRLPSEVVSGLPVPVDLVVLRALALKLQDRYEDMEAFEAALDDLTTREDPVQSKLASTPETFDPFLLVAETEAPAVNKLPLPAVQSNPESAEPFEEAAQSVNFDPILDRPNEIDLVRPTVPERENAVVTQAKPIWQKIPVWGWSMGVMGVIIAAMLLVSGVSQLVGRLTGTVTEESAKPRPTLGVGATQVSLNDGAALVYVPEGEFEMGSNDGDADQGPAHSVYLDAFWIYQTEVTNALYRQCVDAGVCDPPGCGFYGNEAYDDHPVVCVDWNKAQAYCAWAGGSLPTEAQWEKAARGGLMGLSFPWGNEQPVCDAGTQQGAQYSTCGIYETIPVGSFALIGYGLYDMAGNASEWVGDWYASDYYANSPDQNPTGPKSGSARVLRGGSWSSDAFILRVDVRDFSVPETTYDFLGFRCVVAP